MCYKCLRNVDVPAGDSSYGKDSIKWVSATASLTVVSSDRWVQQCNKLFIRPGQLVAYSSHLDELVSMGNIFRVLSYSLKYSVGCIYLALRYTYKHTSHARTQQRNVFHFILNFITSACGLFNLEEL